MPPLSTNPDPGRPRQGPLTWGVRVALVLVFVVLAGVVGLSVWLDPYDGEGRPRTMETHTQLGLPPCTFKVLTGKPCPSCGLTTSIALLAHGDPVNSVRANWVGTLMALFGLAVLPWAAACLVRGRLLGVRSLERALTWAVAFFLALLLLRWAVLLLVLKEGSP